MKILYVFIQPKNYFRQGTSFIHLNGKEKTMFDCYFLKQKGLL